MERLTTRNRNGTVGVVGSLRYYNYGDIKGVLERLAEYEDIGMEPAEITKALAQLEDFKRCGMHWDDPGPDGEPGAIIPEKDIPYLRELLNQRMSMREDVSERWKLTKDVPLDRLREIVEADRDGWCVVLPCKPGDDLYWYNDDEGKVKCNKSGVKGVVVLKNGFSVLNHDGDIDEIGGIYSCLSEEECRNKYGIKPENQHFIRRFMGVN